MTFDFVKKSHLGTFQYTIMDRDILLLTGMYKGEMVSDLIDKKHGYQYLQYLINENIVDADFLAIVVNMAQWKD